MLVLTRDYDEEIIIDVPGFPPIRVAYLGRTKSKYGKSEARIGILADPTISIVRKELYDQAGTSSKAN